MKRTTLAVLMVALALVALAAPAAFAQAPAPKVTINGLIDNLTSYSSNVSNADGGLLNKRDKQWYGRTRGVFDFIGEVGKVKGVFSLEMDFAYGQTGGNNSQLGATPGTTPAAFADQNGDQCAASLNIDVRGCLKVKWLYVEFPIPLIPVPSTARLGLQPFGSDATYKVAAYAQGEFAGVNIASQITPNVKILATYVQVEENLTGTGTVNGKPTNPNSSSLTGSATSSTQNRGDDFAYILSAEVTPMKGLDIKPIFSQFYAAGTTSSSARLGRGGISASTPFANPDGSSHGDRNEYRQTVGLDARYRMGPFSLDPTVLYQFGSRTLNSATLPANFADAGVVGIGGSGRNYRAQISAWLVDVREGFQLGPLLVEALQVYSTGNSSRNTTLKNVHYYQPLDTDTSYLADWGTQLTSLGLDYLNALNEAAQRVAYPGNGIGWDKYGRGQVGLKATYALTPTLSLMAGVNGHWTAEGVDKSSIPVTAIGSLPAWNVAASEKRSHYIGTEFMTVLSWRFTPGISFDNGFGYMIPGQALTNLQTDPTQGPRNAKDIYMFTSRVRYTF